MKEIIFGIVCFREKFWDTITFKRLSELNEKIENQEKLNIVIFDNTDLPKWDAKNDFVENSYTNLVYLNDNSNQGISKAYNSITEYARKNKFPYSVFLD